MADVEADLELVGDVAEALTDVGVEPILVGGMALVLIGSRRVTFDFDFVITRPGDDRLQSVVNVLYERGFELASRLDENGDIKTTIDNPRIAAIRIRIDGPDSVFFFNRKQQLRIDLLFDFPVPATTLAAHAKSTKVRSHVIRMASEPDLLHLKTIAHAKRAAPGDAQDIAFLQARRKQA